MARRYKLWCPCPLPGGTIFGSVAKWQCCSLREATSAALPYTRRAGLWAVAESTRPVQPTSTQPPAPSPKRNFMVPDPRRRGGCSNAAIQQNSNNIGEWTRLDEGFRILGGQGCGPQDATSPRFQSMWPLLSVRVCKLLCAWAPLKGPLHIIRIFDAKFCPPTVGCGPRLKALTLIPRRFAHLGSCRSGGSRSCVRPSGLASF